MGFWPYFLQVQASEGGPSLLCFLFSFSSIFTVTTVFSDIFLHVFQTRLYLESDVENWVLENLTECSDFKYATKVELILDFYKFEYNRN